MTIKKGDWVKVPAGTKLEWADRYWPHGKPETTKRDVVVQVTQVARNVNNLNETLPEPLRSEYVARIDAVPSPHEPGKGYNHAAYDKWHKDIEAIRDEFEERVIAADPFFGLTIFWGSRNDKLCAARDVQLTEAPPAKPKKEPKINKRQQMVKGSKWRFTQDLDIFVQSDNPAYNAAVQAVHKAHPRPTLPHGAPGHQQAWRDWQNDHQAALNAITEPEHISAKIGTAQKDDVFTVTDKITSSWGGYGWRTNNGLLVPAKFDRVAKVVMLPYKVIEPCIEPESIPTVDVYVLRNKATGKFFKGTVYNEEASQAARKAAGSSYIHGYQVWEAEFADEFMKAKHYDGIARAKSSILEATGYYHNLPGAENLPEWMGGSATFEFTQDYELVKFDKLARKEVETFDLWDWYQTAWRLRELTVKFGSSVRGCYKELEKKNLLDEQSGMIVFTAGEDAQDRAYMHGDRSALTPEDKAEIASAIEVAGLKKGKYKRGEDSKSVAVSFPNKGAAMMFKLSYNGNLKMSVIDLADMREVVEEAA